MSTFLTILCQHFRRFCVNISSDSDDCVGATVKVTRCLPPARWPSSDLICPIFSNKWLYLDISRILQIHDQGNSDILLSVGWSFKMAWSLINATRCNAQKLFFQHLTIDENGWFYFNRQEWLILVFLSPRLVDSTQTENQHSGRCMPFWRWETTKWVTEATKCEPLSTKWVTETWN